MNIDPNEISSRKRDTVLSEKEVDTGSKFMVLLNVNNKSSQN